MNPKLTITTPAILAIDLRKFNSDFCSYDPSAKTTQLCTIATSPETLGEVIAEYEGSAC